MKLVLKNQEISMCIDALDFYARMFMGQYDEIDDVLNQYLYGNRGLEQNKFERMHIYTAMRSLEIPELKGWDLNGSLGIWNEATDSRAKAAYDMKQIMCYQDAWCRNPQGGTGHIFEEPVFHGNLPKIECECYMEVREKRKFEIMELEMEEENFLLLKDSINIYWLMLNCRIKKMMRYFTDKKLVLELAGIVEKLYEITDPEDASPYQARWENIRRFGGKLYTHRLANVI